MSSVSREASLQQLEKVLASDVFAGAERSRVLLKFVVEHAIDSQSDRLKEYTIGSEALGRGDSFDPRIDPIVRAEASRLRSRLERYYALEGVSDTVLITLPKGSYVPLIQTRVITETGPQAPEGAGGRPMSGRLHRLAWFLLGGITVGGAVALSVWVRGGETPPAGHDALEFPVELTLGDRVLGSSFGNDVILSPDGTRIVFVAQGPDGAPRLMTQRLILGERMAAELPDTEGGRTPFFSPDGRWVGFWADGKLKKTSLDGGSPAVLADAVDFGGGSWGEDGQIIAGLGRTLSRFSSSPGEPVVVLDLTRENLMPRWPEILPGGRHVLFTALRQEGGDMSTIEILSLSDRKRTTLVHGGTFGRYVPGGHLLYVNQGTVFALPFDRERPDVRGTGVPILEGVAYGLPFGFAQMDVSRTGTLLYRRSPASRVVGSWIDSTGPIEPLWTRPGAYRFPRVSPDGRRVAIDVNDGGRVRTEVYDREGRATTRLPPVPGGFSPVWTPDGTAIVLAGGRGMSWMNVGDPSRSGMLTRSSDMQIPSSFAPDGTLAYHQLNQSSGFDVWTVPVRSSEGTLTAGESELFLGTTAFETYPSFSPDSRWLAYSAEEGKVWDVYVRAFPADGTKEIKVSDGGGRIPRWLPTGRELVYRTDDHRLMVVTCEVKNGSLVVGKPKEWTPVRLADTGVIANFDLDPGGHRILGLLPAAGADERRNQVTVMLNFPDEVRRRLSPAGR